MNTSALISFIKRGAPDWSRQDILDMINDVQNMVFGRPLHYIRIIDPTTGKDPVLTTTDGVFEYMLDSVDYIGLVYKPSDNSRLAYGYENGALPQRKFTYNLMSSDILLGESRIIFSENPGDGEVSYQAYKRPPELTHEGAKLAIPDQYHILYVAEAVWAIIEQFEHGNSNRWEKFTTESLPQLQNLLDSQSQDLIILSSGSGM